MKLQKTPAGPPPVITLEWCKQQERQRKQAARKAQAQRDIETAKETLNDLDLLMDVAQRRYYKSVKDKDTGEIVYYNSALDMYIWGVTHYGTSWDYVLTNIRCNVSDGTKA